MSPDTLRPTLSLVVFSMLACMGFLYDIPICVVLGILGLIYWYLRFRLARKREYQKRAQAFERLFTKSTEERDD